MIAVQEQVEASLMAQSVSPASPPPLLLQSIHFPKSSGKVKISRIYQDVVFARRESLLNCVINSSGLTERGGEIAKVDIGQHECEFQKKVALFSQSHFHLSHLRSFS